MRHSMQPSHKTPEPSKNDMVIPVRMLDSVRQEPNPGWVSVVLSTGARCLAGLLATDLFLGPSERAAAIPAGPVVMAATHASWLDVPVAMVVSGSLGHRCRLVAAAAVAKKAGLLGRALGFVPLAESPIASLREIKQAIRPGTAIWIFPQAGFVPSHWRIVDTIGASAQRTLEVLNAECAVVPVHIGLSTLRGCRPTITATLGEPIPAGQLQDQSIAAVLADLEREAADRLSGHGAEYRSLLDSDRVLIGGFPLKLSKIRRRVRASAGVDLRLRPRRHGWEVSGRRGHGALNADLIALAAAAMPAALDQHFPRFATLEP